jgi:integrase
MTSKRAKAETKAKRIAADNGGTLRALASQQVEANLTNVWRAVASKKIYEQTQRSGKVCYRILIGYKKDGKKILPSFGEDKRLAIAFQSAWNKAIEKKSSTDLLQLSNVAQIDIRWAMVELGKIGVTLREAVNFYMLHALPEKGFLTITEAMDVYYEEQKARGNSKHSSSKSSVNYRTYHKPLTDYFKSKPLIEITTDDVKKYLVKRGENWGAVHYNSHVNYGARFWNVCAKLKYCSESLNPWEQISKRKKTPRRQNVKIMPAGDVASFFWYVERRASKDKRIYQELALMALNFFAGIRIEEIEKCLWSEIQKNIKPKVKDETKWRITVWSDMEKTSRTKINPISENAIFWLAEAEKFKTRDKIVSDQWKQRMKRLRAAFRKYSTTTRKNKKIGEETPVPMNTGRHCYCSYHLGLYDDYNLTTKRLNHGTVNTMRANYEAIVDREEAEKYFQTFPRSVWRHRISATRKDTKAKWSALGVTTGLEKEFYKDVVETFLFNEWFEWCVLNNASGMEAEQSFDSETPMNFGGADYLLTKDSIQEVYLKLKNADCITKDAVAHVDEHYKLFKGFKPTDFFRV